MATYKEEYNTSLNLLGSLTRVEVPFIKVTFGDINNGYTFGVYDKVNGTVEEASRAYAATKVKFPNYIKSLQVTKINGQVNQYQLDLSYAITDNSDPNFFEKVFSSVSETRKITFSYGDLSMPTFIYRDEEAIITSVTSLFSAKSPVITYTVNAISSATLLTAGNISRPAREAKPSTVIYELLNNKSTGLQEIFYGMKDIGLVKLDSLIAQDDKKVRIEAKQNISVLEYLTYLVSCMTPVSDNQSSLSKSGVYVLNVIDDVSGRYQGPYFTVKKLSSNITESNALETYTIDMGFPSQNIVLDFNVVNNEAYSIFYKYSNKAQSEQYTWRINDEGKMEPVYAPNLSSGNVIYKTTEADRTWWTSVTEYPISANITLKGLLRPALLMSYLRLNMYYFGKKHISSGLYVISKQVDTINETGFKTTLSLVRVGADNNPDEISSVVSSANNGVNMNKTKDVNASYKYLKTGD